MYNEVDRALALPELTEKCLPSLSKSLSLFAFSYGLSRHLGISNRKCEQWRPMQLDYLRGKLSLSSGEVGGGRSMMVLFALCVYGVRV